MDWILLCSLQISGKKMLIQIGLNKFVNDLTMMTSKCRTSNLITLIYNGNFFFIFSVNKILKKSKQTKNWLEQWCFLIRCSQGNNSRWLSLALLLNKYFSFALFCILPSSLGDSKDAAALPGVSLSQQFIVTEWDLFIYPPKRWGILSLEVPK